MLGWCNYERIKNTIYEIMVYINLSLFEHITLDALSNRFSYSKYHQPLFREKGAVKNVSITFHVRHCELRGQLVEMIPEICMEKAKSPSEFLPEFIAEVLLTWSAEQRSFEELWFVLGQLFY